MQVTNDIKYIGVNDREIDLFEGQFMVENGMAYNSYVIIDEKIAVFVDGCFWHGHNCRNLSPSDNSSYWKSKIECNKKHDETITNRFRSRGWTVIRIWECELRKKNREKLIEKIRSCGLIQD